MVQLTTNNFRLAVVVSVLVIIAAGAAWQTRRVTVRAQIAQQRQAAFDDLRGRLAAQRRGFRDYQNVPARDMPDAVAAPSPSPNFTLGIATDFFEPGDYDGDGKTDAAVWTPTAGLFTIRQSSTLTNTTITLGQSGDDPSVIGNYDSDTKVDAAVYRAGTMVGAFSSWIYHPSAGGADVTVTCTAVMDCGKNGDFPAPGDYNGDGKFDFMVQRNHGGNCPPDPNQGLVGPLFPNADFLLTLNGAATHTVIPCIGTATDIIVPGDYDGDGITDIAVARSSAGAFVWTIRKSSTGTFVTVTFGATGTDFLAQGDYDGDGKTDLAVWRPDINPDACVFLVHSVAKNIEFSYFWGKNGDYPVANFNQH